MKQQTEFKRLPMRVDIQRAFSEKPAERDYVLPGLLAGTVGCLYAQGGVGKSFFAVESALEIVAGEHANILQLSINRTGRVVYLSLEDPEAITAERLHSMGEHLSSTAREFINHGLDILPLSGLGFDIFDPEWFAEVQDYCTGARLVIIDTLSRVASLDYNDPAQARQIMRRLEVLAKQTGAAILFLHHISKASVRAGQGSDQTAAQGASALIDDARWAASLSVMSTDEAKGFSMSDKNRVPINDERRKMFLKLCMSKINYSAVEADMWFARGHGGVLKPANLFPIAAPVLAGGKKAKNVYEMIKNGEMTIGGCGDDEYDY